MRLLNLLRKYAAEIEKQIEIPPLSQGSSSDNHTTTFDNIEQENLAGYDWPEDMHDAYEERAAIMECDGGLSRQEAERLAAQICTQQLATSAGHSEKEKTE